MSAAYNPDNNIGFRLVVHTPDRYRLRFMDSQFNYFFLRPHELVTLEEFYEFWNVNQELYNHEIVHAAQRAILNRVAPIAAYVQRVPGSDT